MRSWHEYIASFQCIIFMTLVAHKTHGTRVAEDLFPWTRETLTQINMISISVAEAGVAGPEVHPR